MRYLCSGFGANVTICGACAADLGQERKSAARAAPSGGLVKHAFSSKTGSVGCPEVTLQSLYIYNVIEQNSETASRSTRR